MIRNALVNYYGLIFMTPEQRAELQAKHKAQLKVDRANRKAFDETYCADARLEFLKRQETPTALETYEAEIAFENSIA